MIETPEQQHIVDTALAEEYGRLDAKHDMEFAPRPQGYEDIYTAAYRKERAWYPPPLEPVVSENVTNLRDHEDFLKGKPRRRKRR